MNKSSSKASFSFSKANRFSSVAVNKHGQTITVLGPQGGKRSRVGFSGSAHNSPARGPPRAIKPLNMQSGSIDLAVDGALDDYGDENGNGYGEESGPNQPGSLSRNTSMERLPGQTSRRKGPATELHHYGKGAESSLGGGTAMRRHPRARSTIHGSVKTYMPRTEQASAPFHSSGPRFALSPKQCK